LDLSRDEDDSRLNLDEDVNKERGEEREDSYIRNTVEMKA